MSGLPLDQNLLHTLTIIINVPTVPYPVVALMQGVTRSTLAACWDCGTMFTPTLGVTDTGNSQCNHHRYCVLHVKAGLFELDDFKPPGIVAEFLQLIPSSLVQIYQSLHQVPPIEEGMHP
jgi:hypothetical protein